MAGPLQIHFLTFLAITAFASNSLLCRFALGEDLIDPASFSSIRLASGAILLFIYVKINQNKQSDVPVNWLASLSLFVYVVCFSYAYVQLSVSTGALILFTTLQIVFLAASFIKGERPTVIGTVGFLLAMAGFFFIVTPDNSAAPITSIFLMIAAGIAAGIYSILGKSGSDPLITTAKNFIAIYPLIIGLFILAMIQSQHLTLAGVTLAIFSGAFASGIGYVLWYRVLPHLNYIQVSSTQFSVPLVSAFLGILVLDEALTTNLIFACIFILGGLWMTFFGRKAASVTIGQHH